MAAHLSSKWQGWLAWLLYGGSGLSLMEVAEQDERSSLGYDLSSAGFASVPMVLLAVVLAVLLWRLAAPPPNDSAERVN